MANYGGGARRSVRSRAVNLHAAADLPQPGRWLCRQEGKRIVRNLRELTMKTLTRRAWLRGALALLSGGCALTAKQTPTPAPNLDVRGLELPPPGEHFYVIVFGSQSTPKRPAYSHTFATVAHTAE